MCEYNSIVERPNRQYFHVELCYMKSMHDGEIKKTDTALDYKAIYFGCNENEINTQ